MSVIDILFIAILGVFAFFSYRRGFMRTILEVVAFILAIVVASFASKPVGGLLYKGFMRGSIENHIENAIEEINFDDKVVTKDQGAKIVVENIPEFAMKIAVNSGNTTEGNLSTKVKNSNFTSVTATNAVLEKVVDPIVQPSVNAIAFIILSAVLIFLFRLFAKMISKENEKDGFSADKFFGGLFGLAKGIVIVYVVCAALQLIYLSNADTSQGLGEMLTKSQVFNFMVNNNPIIEGIKNMF